MKTESVTIHLSPEIAHMISREVSSGEFASSDEVVLAALEEWVQYRQMDEAMIADIAAGVQEGLADIESGRLFTSEEVFAELRKRLTASGS